jgi:hypothetical protein
MHVCRKNINIKIGILFCFLSNFRKVTNYVVLAGAGGECRRYSINLHRADRRKHRNINRILLCEEILLFNQYKKNYYLISLLVNINNNNNYYKNNKTNDCNRIRAKRNFILFSPPNKIEAVLFHSFFFYCHSAFFRIHF